MCVIVLMLAVSWKNVFGYYSSIAESYKSHIEKAEAYMKKEIYIDAVGEYELALKVKSDDYDTAMKIVDLYDELKNESGWVKACQNAISADESKKEPYLKLADYYIENSNFQDAYNILTRAEKVFENEEDIKSRLIDIKSRYTLEGLNYDTITPFYYSDDTKTGYMIVSADNKKGLLDSSRKVKADVRYEEIGLFGQDVIPVCVGKEWYYIDGNGYRKLVPDTPAQYLGTFHNDYAPAKIDGVYGYLNKKMEELHFEYEYAGCFSNGVAAVKKNGKWAVINTSFKNITEFDFDDILIDENGFCCIYNVFFAKKDDRYYLYNLKGECISEGFDDAKLFASDEPAAVKKDGKWGFVSKSGEVLSEIGFEYEDADSFSLGYAPYCERGKWGCIDEKGESVINPFFDLLKPFSHNGFAFAESGDVQELVVIKIYK